VREIRDDNPSTSAKPDFTQYFRLLWRKKHFVLVPTFLAVAVAVVGVRFVAPVYESASVIVLQSQSYLGGEEMGRFVTVQDGRDRREATASDLDKRVLAQTTAEVKSPEFLDQLVGTLGIADNPTLVEKARRQRELEHPNMSVEELVHHGLREVLAAKIQVSLEGPGMYRVACYDNDPETSYLLAKSVTDLFVESRRVKHLRGLQQASEFTGEQLEISRERLKQSETDLDALKRRITELSLRKNPVGGADPSAAGESGRESNLRLAESLKEQLDIEVREVEDRVTRVEGRVATYLGYVPKSAGIWENSDTRKIENALAAQRETELLLELQASGVSTENLDRQRAVIQDTEGLLQHQMVELVDTQFADVNREYRPAIVEYFYQIGLWRSLQAKVSKLAFYISGYKQQLSEMPVLETELIKLQDEVSTNREIYNSFLKAKTAAQVSEAAESAGLAEAIDVVQQPVRPLLPVRPKKMMIVLLAAVFGAGLGVAGLAVSEYTDTSFRNVEDVEKRLGLRVLGTIPLIEANPDLERVGKRKQVVVWAVTSLLVAVLSLLGFYYYGKIVGKQATHVHVSKTVDH
jgi:polysaccharide biosynthesis transport protein